MFSQNYVSKSVPSLPHFVFQVTVFGHCKPKQLIFRFFSFIETSKNVMTTLTKSQGMHIHYTFPCGIRKFQCT